MKKYKGFIVGLLVGSILMITVPAIANTVKQYVLVEVSYPILVNDTEYESSELPILNYEL